METSKIDITANAEWTNDCCGKQDLDFSFIDCHTRYWKDNSAQCDIVFMNNFNPNLENGYAHAKSPVIYLAKSDIMYGSSEKDIKDKVKSWYNANIIQATVNALSILRGEKSVKDFKKE